MFLRLVLTALVAGLIGGIGVSALQTVGTTPLILEAETYEKGRATAGPATGHDQGHAHDHGWERAAFTVLANVLMAVGFAALLASAFTVVGGVEIVHSLWWGLAGFAAFSFIPSVGLPPELPGMVAADIAARQLWWWSSAIANCAGLALLAFAPRIAWKALGGLIILLPFLVGAPHPGPAAGAGAVPPELAARFVTVSLGTGLAFWLVLATSAAWSFRRFERFCLPAGGEARSGRTI